MKFLCNTYDPKREDARYMVAVRYDETPQEAWRNYQGWLRSKVIGKPRATAVYTVEQLENMGYVGVYTA